MAAPADRTYWILEEHQLAAMNSPRRHEILDRLAASGPMSIKELAQQIGAQPSALYHHMQKLVEAGLVIEAGFRISRRRRQQLYTTPAPRMRMARALAEERFPEILVDIVHGLTRQMARDFGNAVTLPQRVAEGEERNLGFFRLLGRPSPAQLARINACLAEVAEILWRSGNSDEPLITFSWVMTPVAEE